VILIGVGTGARSKSLDLAQDAVLGLHAPLKSPAGTTENFG
jgi:hypothetical protein